LVSLPRLPRRRFLLYTSIVTLLLVSIPLIVGYSILLTSMAGILAASIGLGASLTVMLRWLRHAPGDVTTTGPTPRGSGRAAPASSPTR
jgi:hypothetical protein